MVELTLLILDVVLLDIVSPYLQTFLVDAFNLYYLQLSLSVKWVMAKYSCILPPSRRKDLESQWLQLYVE